MAFGLRNKDARRSLRVPLQGVAIVVLSIALFLVWLGALAAVTKAVMG